MAVAAAPALIAALLANYAWEDGVLWLASAISMLLLAAAFVRVYRRLKHWWFLAGAAGFSLCAAFSASMISGTV